MHIEKYFTGTVSRVGGITLEDIEENVEKLHSEAFDPLGLPTDLTLDSVGAHKMRSQGEEHRYNPQTIHLLQQSTWTGSYDLFKQYTDLVDKENHGNLRGLLDFKFAEGQCSADFAERCRNGEESRLHADSSADIPCVHIGNLRRSAQPLRIPCTSLRG